MQFDFPSDLKKENTLKVKLEKLKLSHIFPILFCKPIFSLRSSVRDVSL